LLGEQIALFRGTLGLQILQLLIKIMNMRRQIMNIVQQIMTDLYELIRSTSEFFYSFCDYFFYSWSEYFSPSVILLPKPVYSFLVANFTGVVKKLNFLS
jgi:hypothetical protein